MQEIWKDIEGFKGIYQISNLGRVKSFRCKKKKILKACVCPYGYLQVNLRMFNVQSIHKIHKLVAVAFLNHKPCGTLIVINHIDFNKQNNNVNNLELVTFRENTNKKHLSHSSKYTGVSWHKRFNKWQSSIRINGKLKYIGSFINEIDAATAYDKELLNLNK